eukprot:SAG31_NODE_3133_length_4638_cov_6.219432_3_plen_84_part_00
MYLLVVTKFSTTSLAFYLKYQIATAGEYEKRMKGMPNDEATRERFLKAVIKVLFSFNFNSKLISCSGSQRWLLENDTVIKVLN